MKAFLLFFDGIALAIPSDLATRVIEQDPVLAQPLLDRRLLVNLAPESNLDQASAERLAHTLLELLEYNRGDFWWSGKRKLELAAGHWGATVAPEAADAFFKELRRRGLAEGSVDDDVIPCTLMCGCWCWLYSPRCWRPLCGSLLR